MHGPCIEAPPFKAQSGAMDSATLLLTLVVRLYDSAMVAAADRRPPTVPAGAILEASDIATTCPLCSPPKPRPNPATGVNPTTGLSCNRPIGAGELAIHLVRGQTPVGTHGRL